MKSTTLLILLSLTVTACGASRSVQPARPPPPAAAKTPEGCGRDYPANAPLMSLAPTREPSTKTQKSEPFQFANEIRVHGDLTSEGLWTDYPDGWSTLALRFASEDAKSLALHLTQVKLPPRSQIWFCSGDGKFKQGPYREAIGGELWTPVVPGEEAKLQIDVPTAAKHDFHGEIEAAFGGFR
jgi:hypothetical protein